MPLPASRNLLSPLWLASLSVTFPDYSNMLDVLSDEQLGGGCEIALAVSDRNDVSVTPETALTADGLSVISFTLKKVPNSDSQR